MSVRQCGGTAADEHRCSYDGPYLVTFRCPHGCLAYWDLCIAHAAEFELRMTTSQVIYCPVCLRQPSPHLVAAFVTITEPPASLPGPRQ